MNDLVIKSLAAVAALPDTEEAPFGSFEVILSTPSMDRDGEEVLTNEWELPLPEHITFDIDHGMSVSTTVGSGTPSIDDQGRLIVRGTFASTDLAQQTRALVNEGHIRTVSVAFLRKESMVDGVKTTRRELLNGAFVAIPANPEAQVMTSKALDPNAAPGLADALGEVMLVGFAAYAMAHRAHWNVAGQDFAEYHALFGSVYEDLWGATDGYAENVRKLGLMAPALTLPGDNTPASSDARGLASELLGAVEAAIPSIKTAFDLATAAGEQGIANYLADRQDAHAKWAWQLRASLGVAQAAPVVARSANVSEVARKTIIGTIEAQRDRVADALEDTYENEWCYIRGVFADGRVVYVSYMGNGGECTTYQENFTDDGTTVTLAGDRIEVDVMEVVVPDVDEETDAEKSSAAAPAVKAAAPADEDTEVELLARSLQLQAEANF